MPGCKSLFPNFHCSRIKLYAARENSKENDFRRGLTQSVWMQQREGSTFIFYNI